MLTIVLSATSCKKFLASYSQNQTFIQTATDLDEVLIADGYNTNISGNANFLPVWVDLMDDDIEANPSSTFSGSIPVFTYTGVHHWQPVPLTKSDGTEVTEDFYTGLYRRISALNTILFNVAPLREKGEPADTLQRVSGEAHFLRAYYYFLLVNLYGKPYNTATAATDNGIPLKTDPAVEDKFFARNTVKQVYDQIVSDLLESERELEKYNQQSTIRANQAAAQALLSRIYLYQEDYENAIAYANKVINKNRYRITNLVNHVPGNGFLTNSSAETIFYLPPKGPLSLMYYMENSSFTPKIDNYKVSPDLKNSFSANDLRIQAFFEQAGSGEWMTRKAGTTPNVTEEYMIRLPEIYLNKAEALVISGRTAEAVSALQELRKNRFKPDQLTDVVVTGAELVNFIREERRRECCFEWQRWFDLRRYAVNARYPFVKTIRHPSYNYNSSGRFIEGFYELKSYEQDKAAYVMPIPRQEIEFNRGVLKNEERPVRLLIR